MLESFSERGGALVVAQLIVMTAWLVFTPKGHKLTDSALGRVAAAVLLGGRAVAGVSGALVLGKNICYNSRSTFPRLRLTRQTVETGTPPQRLRRHLLPPLQTP